MRISFIILLLAISVSLLSQDVLPQGNISVIQDPRIDRLSIEYQEIASQIHQPEGFRIQIFFDSGNLSKRNASVAREEFIRRYPSVEAYISFREPYYRVRVGDFRTRLEAEGFRKSILRHYPNAFTVNDQINPTSTK